MAFSNPPTPASSIDRLRRDLTRVIGGVHCVVIDLDDGPLLDTGSLEIAEAWWARARSAPPPPWPTHDVVPVDTSPPGAVFVVPCQESPARRILVIPDRPPYDDDIYLLDEIVALVYSSAPTICDT